MFNMGLITIISTIMLLSACGTNSTVSKKPSQSGALLEDNLIINMHGQVKNLPRMDQFVENVNSKTSDDIKITHYTIEGDPIYDEIKYDGKQLTITNDNTEDKFGSPKITTFTCKDITRNVTDTKLEYLLLECTTPDGSKGNHPIISIDYNLAEQDYFAFRLEYGVDRKNVIDTEKLEIVKDLQNGEFVTVKDFQFSDKDLQQIYKLMVLAGYLGEKKVSTSCKEKPLFSYHLKVWINQGEREFEWNRCDESLDGQSMTKLADDIVEVLKNTETYKGLPEVKSSYQ
jgi:hypothetical protein